MDELREMKILAIDEIDGIPRIDTRHTLSKDILQANFLSRGPIYELHLIKRKL